MAVAWYRFPRRSCKGSCRKPSSWYLRRTRRVLEAQLKQVVAEKSKEVLEAQLKQVVAEKSKEVLEAQLKQLAAEKQAEADRLTIKLTLAETENMRLQGLLHMRGLLGEL
jgi:hypothetical protein